MSAPLLVLDVGNTSLKIGLAAGDEDIAAYGFATEALGFADALGFAVLEVCGQVGVSPRGLAAWAVSSVLPRLDGVIRQAAARYCGCPALFVPDGLPLPVENRYERPAEVGADRLVAAYGAMRLFDAPGYVVIDFGTATTFDCVLPGVYLGGLFCPGLMSSARALAGGTAKLPQADLALGAGPVRFGRSTAESLAYGLVHGFAAMVEGICARLKPFLPEGSLVVGAGGLAQVVARATPAIDVLRPDLLLEGLRLAHEEATRSTPRA